MGPADYAALIERVSNFLHTPTRHTLGNVRRFQRLVNSWLHTAKSSVERASPEQILMMNSLLQQLTRLESLLIRADEYDNSPDI